MCVYSKGRSGGSLTNLFDLDYQAVYERQDLMQKWGLLGLFLREHFLHWMEAMNNLGLAAEVVGSINLLQSVFDVSIH